MSAAKPMSRAQRGLLRGMAWSGFNGYCEAMDDSGCGSWKQVDWVLDALERRGYINYENGEPCVTDAGRAALAEPMVQS